MNTNLVEKHPHGNNVDLIYIHMPSTSLSSRRTQASIGPVSVAEGVKLIGRYHAGY
jgi:hypothetical protein